MIRRKYFSFFLMAFLCIGIIVVSSGCKSDNDQSQKVGTDAGQSELEDKVINDDPIYYFYNQVKLNDAKKDVEKSLGVQADLDADDIYNYVDPSTGYGVFVNYDTNNQVKMKGIYMPEGPEKLIALSGARVREEEVESISKGMKYDEVVSILGAGAVEIIATKNLNDSDNHYYAIGWINEDESLLLVYFLGFKGSVESAEFLKLN